ncbi:MAG: Dam family site-specific DNA-(adenine-N6)-methyltransferase [Gaiella sp.]|nr:Dam family site-specific DNA-(adenine-N6)-methyltransferase [Gaiella sp.]
MAQQASPLHVRGSGTGHVLDRKLLLDGAARSLSAVPRPFLRWAGSKQRVLRQLVPHLPASFDRYFEPFLGAGSLFFLLRPTRVVLADACVELVETYRAVASDPNAVLDWLSGLNPLDKDLYYRVRARRSEDPVRRAAEFIFLNRAGWNGLYRVNSRGEFNVPYGAPKTANLIDSTNLLECSRLLAQRHMTITAGDFERVVEDCEPGDFVFFDPPYVTSHNNNGFIDYNERLFSWKDQIRLAEVVRHLAAKNVNVLVTNANHKGVLDLYADFVTSPISRASTLAGSRAARRPVTETVIRTYDVPS